MKRRKRRIKEGKKGAEKERRMDMRQKERLKEGWRAVRKQERKHRMFVMSERRRRVGSAELVMEEGEYLAVNPP